MDRNHHASTVATLPTVTTSGATAGYVTDGNPALGIPATTITADVINGLIEEPRNAILESGQTPSQSVLTQLASAIKTLGSRQNYIINGSMSVIQRGISFTQGLSVSGYTADRWKVAQGGGGYTSSTTINDFTVGAAEVGGGVVKFARVTVTPSSPGVGSYCVFQQSIEDIRLLAGKTVTLSFYVRASATANFAVELSQFFGTGGSPSADVYVTPQTFTATTSWQKMTATFVIPSIVGKTYGTSPSSHYSPVSFWLGAGSNWNTRTNTLGNQTATVYYDFTKVRLDEGTTAAQWVDIPYQDELLKCQRYFQKSFGDITTPAFGTGHFNAIQFQQIGGPSTFALQNVKFTRNMRVAPTVVIYNPVNSTNAPVNTSTNTDCTATTLINIASTSFALTATTPTGTASGQVLSFHYTADSEL